MDIRPKSCSLTFSFKLHGGYFYIYETVILSKSLKNKKSYLTLEVEYADDDDVDNEDSEDKAADKISINLLW